MAKTDRENSSLRRSQAGGVGAGGKGKMRPGSKPIDPRLPRHDPPEGLPDLGAPGLGAEEMPDGALFGGDGGETEKEKEKK